MECDNCPYYYQGKDDDSKCCHCEEISDFVPYEDEDDFDNYDEY
jgi:hypothetical protein